MDRTLFTPAMIETFRACKRAYHLAFVQDLQTVESMAASQICKRFLLKALAEINRGRLTNIWQIQKFLGQHWPADKIAGEECVKAFLFVYKTLARCLASPYRPNGAHVAGVSLKVRARIPHQRIYLEDTFDLLLWHPNMRCLEFVDYHLSPLKAFNQAWPTASILVKQFLGDRLRTRWPFEQLKLTFCRISPQGVNPITMTLDETLYRAHWSQLLKTIAEMQGSETSSFQTGLSCLCRRCEHLRGLQPSSEVHGSGSISRSA
ncbi:MAG: hypothetical protein HY711_05855 [Candidatus Melainabacteria bacterium]|nr:hypothetical protein [Candidatus Melainabacteria bacterium]